MNRKQAIVWLFENACNAERLSFQHEIYMGKNMKEMAAECLALALEVEAGWTEKASAYLGRTIKAW